MHYDEIENGFEDTDETFEDTDTNEFVPQERKLPASHISNFSPELIMAELEAQYIVNQHYLTEQQDGMEELQQAVVLLGLGLEKLTAFRHATHDYDWRNDKYERAEIDADDAYRAMKRVLEKRQEVQKEKFTTFAARGLEALKDGRMNVSAGYDVCWYGCTHPATIAASSFETDVYSYMQEHGLLPAGWDRTLTPIEVWGIDDRSRVEDFLKEVLPTFIAEKQQA